MCLLLQASTALLTMWRWYRQWCRNVRSQKRLPMSSTYNSSNRQLTIQVGHLQNFNLPCKVQKLEMKTYWNYWLYDTTGIIGLIFREHFSNICQSVCPFFFLGHFRFHYYLVSFLDHIMLTIDSKVWTIQLFFLKLNESYVIFKLFNY